MTIHAIPSSYSPPSNRRAAPPSVRPRAAPPAVAAFTPPEPAEPARETTLRSRPEPGPPPTEPAKVAKKKRAKVTAETRSVAVARVAKLMSAGNLASEATAKVAKELGVSESAVANWRSAANQARGKQAAPARPAKREARSRANGIGDVTLATMPESELIAERLIQSLAGMVRTIVREEIRRMLA